MNTSREATPHHAPVEPAALSAGSPIAVCGLGMRLPGRVRNAADYWQLLLQGHDAAKPIPASRWNPAGWDSSLQGKPSIETKSGYFLDDDLAAFDPSGFSISQSELERCDPQLRLLLKVVHECLEDAGESQYRGQPVACYVGSFGDDWLELQNRDDHTTGNGLAFATQEWLVANRVSYEFDLRGPSAVVRTACSSSLVALHDACRAMQAGDATSAVVAGCNLILTPGMTTQMTAEGILSPEGSSKTFDASADGYGRGEGITALYLKPLDRALRDGNPVRAVIRGVGVNSDGKSSGIFNPSSQAQEALMHNVYAMAGVNPADTAFVECHGTGTTVGDPIELSAVGNVFGDRGVLVGSVKPNIGHTEGSAGLASLIKAILSLENRTIPPNIKFQTPNPKIPFKEKRLVVPTVATPLPANRAERISVNSFGIGGTNAHAIVESFNSAHTNGNHEICSPKLQLLVFSAYTSESLKKQIQLHKEFIINNPEKVTDVAYTRALRRVRMPNRAFAIMKGTTILQESATMSSPSSMSKREVCMVFSGQGAQWAGMGKELLQSCAEFRADIGNMDGILAGLENAPGWSITAELMKSPEASRVNIAEISQPLCTALQIGLVRQFERSGVIPAAVVGHSSGEIAAAYASGHITLESAIKAAYYRGLALKNAPAGGAMAVVGMGADEIRPLLPRGVVVACENSPSNTTVSGDDDRVQEFLSLLREHRPDLFCRQLKVNAAYHSHHMTALGDDYLRLLLSDKTSSSNPRAQFISSVTGALVEDPSAIGSVYWVTNLVRPVRFQSAVSDFLSRSGDKGVFLEIGPHSALSVPLREICNSEKKKFNYTSAQVRGGDSLVGLVSALGTLYQLNVDVDFQNMFPHGQVVPGLPTYPWDEKNSRLWFESRLAKEWRGRQYPSHCLLGTRVIESSDNEPMWRNLLDLENVPWLFDHKVGQDIVFPFAGYVAMAGEAVRQIGKAEKGASYRLRRVVARTALVLFEGKPVDLMTTIRKRRLTNFDESPWYEFTITSHNGACCVEHCSGQVILSEEETSKSQPRQQLRQVNGENFYSSMRCLGYKYGDTFRGLCNITASPTEKSATAAVISRHDESVAACTLHPATVDGCLQLMIVAMAKGLSRNLNNLCVPVGIDELFISRPGPDMIAQSFMDSGGEVLCVSKDRVVLNLKGLQMKPVNRDQEADEAERNITARVEWLPKVEFLDLSKLIQPPPSEREFTILQHEMTLLCILQDVETLDGVKTSQAHLTKYRDWLNMQVQDAATGNFPLVRDAQRLIELSSESREKAIGSYLAHMNRGQSSALAIETFRSHQNVKSVFEGKGDILDIMMQGNVLTELYNCATFDCSRLIQLFAHSRPNLRILEVGAGTGGTTEMILRHLVKAEGYPAYSSYTFTDVSAGFFPKAKERFAYAPNVDYKVFDISIPPSQQGFGNDLLSYDIILATNVVHATPCIRESLRNMSQLLKPNGRLVLTELLPNQRAINYPFGMLAGWWMGENDRRIWSPLVSVERWHEELRSAGMSGVDTVAYSDESPFNQVATIISTPQPQSQLLSPLPKRVTLLTARPRSDIIQKLHFALQRSGQTVTICPPASTPPPESDVISCLSLEPENLLQPTSESSFQAFRTLIHKLCPSPLHHHQRRILHLLPPVQLHSHHYSSNATAAALFAGLARTLRAEIPGLDLYTLEIGNGGLENEPQIAEAVVKVLDHIRRENEDYEEARGDRGENGGLAPDREYAISSATSQICVPRYRPFSLVNEKKGAGSMLAPKGESAQKKEKKRTPQIRLSGGGTAMESLRWVGGEEKDGELGDDEVEIETKATGLIFHDLLSARGILPSSSSGHGHDEEEGGQVSHCGGEMAGVITRIGGGDGAAIPRGKTRGQQSLRVGDRVLGLASGCLKTRVVTKKALVCRIPRDWRWEEAAGMSLNYATVLLGLVEIGKMAPGMSVLVHSACGGVGLAALEVCKMMGIDEVYVTVGSERKVEFLMARYGIPRERIFGSRDEGFVEGLMRETEGQGVDVVLNSLSGELLQGSWKCVAEWGTMVDLSQRDSRGCGSLDMLPFTNNRAYHGVNLARYMESPKGVKRLGQLLETMMQHCRSGRLPLIKDLSVYEAQDIIQAFLHLESGDHIGKIVVRTGPALLAPEIEATPLTRRKQFEPSVAYLLIGGMGGLGRSIATWMVERGARNLVFLSRGAGNSEASKLLVEELEAMGCSATTVAGSVDKMEDVRRAINMSQWPIKGVIQLAMVLRDTSFGNMTWSQWSDVLKPKVDGTWNLHKAFLGQKLDFFCMASTMSTAFGSAGQGNYVAANTFLESFCQYRHALGLPASVVNICAVADVGYVAENPQARQHIQSLGMAMVSEREFLEVMELSLLDSHADGRDKDTELETFPSSTPPTPWVNRQQIFMGLQRDESAADNDADSCSWRRDRRMGLYHNTRAGDGDKNVDRSKKDGLGEFLEKVSRPGGRQLVADGFDLLAGEIGRKIRDIMLKTDEDEEDEIDGDVTLTQMGFDSLMSIELRRWFKRAMNVELSVLEMVGCGTFGRLVRLVLVKLGEGLDRKAAEGGK